MLVTILTVAFNAEKTIAKTMESVLNQTYDDIEYIVIDGASKDKTVEVARNIRKYLILLRVENLLLLVNQTKECTMG